MTKTEISSQAQPQGSNRPNGKATHYITPEFALSEGIENNFNLVTPKATVCEFCGKPVDPKGLYFPLIGKVIAWTVECDCEQSELSRAKLKAEKERAEAEAQKERERAELLERIKRNTKLSRIPPRLQKQTFDTFTPRNESQANALRWAREYAENFKMHFENGAGLYFEGDYGTGKTHLSTAIALNLLSKGFPVICESANALMLDIKKSQSFMTNISDYELFKSYCECHLLVIDDIGHGKAAAWQIQTLYDIINYRYENLLPIIITTNRRNENLLQFLTIRYGFDKSYQEDEVTAKAIISRLSECTRTITITGEDYRKRGA
jgi:DNA replication protein DnaC